jgi:uncharacterized membrane protein YedE/YeeE
MILPERTRRYYVVLVVSIALFAGFFAGEVACNHTYPGWPRNFISVVSGFLGAVLELGPFAFVCAFKSLFQLNFIDGFHLMVVTTFAMILVQFVFNYDSHGPLFRNDDHFSLSGDPVGVALFLGSFIFGIGMYLSSTCSIGALIGVGEGTVSNLITLVFFIVGSTLAVQDGFYDWFSRLPKAPNSVVMSWYLMAIVLGVWVAACFAVELIRYVIDKRHLPDPQFGLQEAQQMYQHGWDHDAEEQKKPGYKLKKVRLYVVDFAVAALLFLWFFCVGRPIEIVPPLAMLGSRFVGICGGKPDRWNYWHNQPHWKDLPRNLMQNDLFLSDVYIILGSFIGAALFGKFGKTQQWAAADLIKAVCGGLCLGIGGVMSGGCTVGSMLAGLIESSVRGPVWAFSALLGYAVPWVAEWAIKKRFNRTDPAVYAALP